MLFINTDISESHACIKKRIIMRGKEKKRRFASLPDQKHPIFHSSS